MDTQTENQNFHKCCGAKNKNLMIVFAVVAIIFVASATLFMLAGAVNKMKEGKYIGQGNKVTNTISVSGSGEIYAKPDLAIADFSVVTSGKTVAETITSNSQKMNAVIDAIKKSGVNEKDLKTTNYSLVPNYQYPQVQAQIYPYLPSVGTIVGYQITQTLEVKIRNLDNVGQIVQVATQSGANQVGNMQFTIDNPDEFKNQARTQAINEAKAKAKELASELGVSLGRITNFSENNYFPYDYATANMSVSGKGGGAAVPAPEIQTGESKVTSSVSITYEIN